MRRQILAAIALVLLLSSLAGAQTTWFVDQVNCPGPGDGSAGNPFCSIQDAIDTSVNGDSVEVAPGTYIERIDLDGKAITLYSSDGPFVTTLDGDGLASVVQCVSGEGTDTVIDGFAITGGVNGGGNGAAIHCVGASPTVRHCRIYENFAANGPALFAEAGSNPLLVNCLIHDNVAFIAGVIHSQNSSPQLVNCTIALNQSVAGGTILNSGASFPDLRNTILWTLEGTAIEDVSGALTNAANCVIEGGWPGFNIDEEPRFVNVGLRDFRLDRFSPAIDLGDNDAVPAGIATDLSEAPRFFDDFGVTDTGNDGVTGPPIVDAGAHERQFESQHIVFLVSPASPIQSTIHAVLDGDTIQLNPGVYSQTFSMLGKAITLRSQDPENPAVVAATILDGTGLGDSIIRCVSGETAGTVIDGLTFTGGTGNTTELGIPAGGALFIAGSSPTVRRCVFIDNQANFSPSCPSGSGGDTCAEAIPASIPSGIVNTVDNTASNIPGTPCGIPWTGFRDEWFCWTAPCDGTADVFLPGLLFSNQEERLCAVYDACDGSAITCGFSFFNPNPLGNGNAHVQWEATAGTTYYLRFASNNGAVDSYNFGLNITCTSPAPSGGAAYIAGPSTASFTDCRFMNNLSLEGGAIACDGAAPSFNGCSFEGGEASFGGAAFLVNSDVTFRGSRFLGNTAGFYGGAAYIDTGSTAFINCVFSGNTAALHGSAVFELGGGTLDFFNCTLYGHTAAISVIFDQNAHTTVVNSIIWNNEGLTPTGDTVLFNNIEGSAGSLDPSNIDADPRFLDPAGADGIVGTADDDLRILFDSPCIDAGDNALVPPGVTEDDEGDSRLIDGDGDAETIVDMGADEVDPATAVGVLNVTKGLIHTTFADAIGQGAPDDELHAGPGAFLAEPVVDYAGKAVSIRGLDQFEIPSAASYTFADGALLGTVSLDSINVLGALTAQVGDDVTVHCDQLVVGTTGSIHAQPGAIVDVTAPGGVANSGSLLVQGAVLATSDGLHNMPLGILTMYGDLFSDFTNDNQATFLADTQVIGDYTNNGTTTMQNGVLSIIGSLINNGTIIGPTAESANPGGMFASGDYLAGSGASLLMPSPELTFKVGGNFNVAIDDNTRYDMSQAELRLVGLEGALQDLEIMSLDIGPDPLGFDHTLPGHYPIGRLRVGPTPTVVNMVDNLDNDGLGQSSCEAIYARNLIIETGATFNTNGCPVYYQSLTVNGAVDNPDNLIQIAACAADLNHDNVVNVLDLLVMLGAWGSNPGHAADLNGDDVVNVLDLLQMLGAWGNC